VGAIDFHSHLAAGDPSKEPPFLRALFDVEGYLDHQEAAGVETTVLSNALMTDVPGDELAWAQAQHEFLEDLLSRHPGRFAALAGVNPWAGERWIEEAGRALDAGFSGLVVEPGRDGRYLDAPEAQDFFAFANERAALVFVHPSQSPVSDEQTGDPMLTLWIGRPYDTGICLTRMLMADTLGAYPEMKLVVAHAGGVIPMLLGRLDRVHGVKKMIASFAAAGAKAGGGPPGGPPGAGGVSNGEDGGGPAANPPAGEVPSMRMRSLYLDTACYHPAGIVAALAAVGVDHVVFGSDHPPVDPSPQPSVEVIEEMDLSAQDREKIMSANARRLLAR
jgi:aminocarboxymuconate-semialdehyde decarboxylase